MEKNLGQVILSENVYVNLHKHLFRLKKSTPIMKMGINVSQSLTRIG